MTPLTLYLHMHTRGQFQSGTYGAHVYTCSRTIDKEGRWCTPQARAQARTQRATEPGRTHSLTHLSQQADTLVWWLQPRQCGSRRHLSAHCRGETSRNGEPQQSLPLMSLLFNTSNPDWVWLPSWIAIVPAVGRSVGPSVRRCVGRNRCLLGLQI